RNSVNARLFRSFLLVFCIFLLLCIIVFLYFQFAPYFMLRKPGTPPLSVTIDRATIVGTSQLSPGISLVDNTLDSSSSDNDINAINNAKSLIKQAIPYENTSIMAWGAPDPWPDPSQAEPSNWSYLDDRLHFILDTGGIPVLTLCEAPWWMEGQ